jgi:hypothetical protein
MWRPRPKSVIVVLLLWQLAAGLLLAGPAVASTHTGMATDTTETHCHAHPAGLSTAPAPASGSFASAQHASAIDCCQSVNACHCACAQGTAAISPMLAMTSVVADPSDQADFRSPPLVRRIAGVFRPPI